MDTRYRDECVSTASLGPADFDPLTGLIPEPQEPTFDSMSESMSESYADAPPSMYDIPFVGQVSGAKPPIGSCMPMRSTPLISTDYSSSPNNAFTYYMNMNDANFPGENNNNGAPLNSFNTPMSYGLPTSQYDILTPDIDVANTTNYVLGASAFFIGGASGCPDMWKFDTPPPMERDTLYERADFRRFQAENCYDYYILNHSVAPWFTLERPGTSTNDPLTQDDPDKAIRNDCQPLIRGSMAYQVEFPPPPQYGCETVCATGTPSSQCNINTVQQVTGHACANSPGDPWGCWSTGACTAPDGQIIHCGGWLCQLTMLTSQQAAAKAASHSGYSPVYRMDRSDGDEAEYLLGTYLQMSWDEDFVDSGAYELKSPIVKVFSEIGLPCVQDGNYPPPFEIYPPPPAGDSPPQPSPAPPGSKCHPDTPPDTPPESHTDICPKPFFGIPGDYDYHSPDHDRTSPYYCPNVEKITEPSNPYSPRNDMTGVTDRDFSELTSMMIGNPNTCSKTQDWAYTDWNYPGGNGIDGQRNSTDRTLNPVVQCAIVPVDILSFRYDAFETCIMQRIAYNYDEFIKEWIESGSISSAPFLQRTDHGDGGPGPFVNPCKTRFWETDEPDNDTGCPVTMSIQQCCRIIIKDVVPANFVKLRTCEGLRQERMDNPQLKYINLVDYDDGTSVHYTSPNTTESTVKVPTDWKDATAKSEWLNQETSCEGTEPEEYYFANYFDAFDAPADPWGEDAIGGLVGYNMPYMRWWDTGVSAGNQYHGGSFVNTLGSWDTLVGVGREERSEDDAQDAQYEADQAEQDGGTPSKGFDFAEPEPSQVGRVGGWAELKAHEMWTIRRDNLFCIGRYEKLFKQGGAENFVLAKGGAGYTSKTGVQWPWSLGWRGYVTDPNDEGFPTALGGGDPGSMLVGLDNALPGDIITYYINGMPQVAYVTDIGGYAMPGSDTPLAGNISAQFDSAIGKFELGSLGSGIILHPTRLYILTWDQGKFPTAAGSTIMWGMGPQRTLYKVSVPDYFQQEVCNKTLRALTDYVNPQTGSSSGFCRENIADDALDPGTCVTEKCQPSCEDSDYSSCVLPYGAIDWNDAQIYRPKFDQRQCDLPITGGPQGSVFDMASTYDWQGEQYLFKFDSGGNPIEIVNPLSLPGPQVLTQSLTGTVDTSTWAACYNAGYDPPWHWSKEYKGPQAGARTKTDLCGPKWHTKILTGMPTDQQNGCSAATNKFEFFPTTSR